MHRAVIMTPGFRVGQFMAAVFAVTAAGAFMPLWFADRGLSAAAIGQVLGFASLFRVMSGPGWGTMADRVGRRRPVMTTAAIIAMTMSLSYLPLHSFLALPPPHWGRWPTRWRLHWRAKANWNTGRCGPPGRFPTW
jgi:MFS family permease